MTDEFWIRLSLIELNMPTDCRPAALRSLLFETPVFAVNDVP